MTGILALFSDNINSDIYKYLGIMTHRGNYKNYYSDGIRAEIKNFYEGEPTFLEGPKCVVCCGFKDTKYICYTGFSVVYDGVIDLDYFKNVTNPLKSIERLIDESNDKFFGIYISESEIYAFKDKTGSKPGMYGLNSEGKLVICSEDLGFNKTDDIYGGEIFHVKDDLITRNGGNKKVKPNIYEFLFFSRNISNIYNVNVGEFKYNLSKILVENFKQSFNVVLSTCENTRLMGLTIANLLKVPYIEPKIIPTYRKKYTPNTDKYQFSDIHFKYDNVLIVDLFIASGKTAKFFVDTYKKHNCSNITFLSLSPKDKIPDIGPKEIDKENLLNSDKAEEYIGCNIIYNTEENLKNASGFEEISY